MAHTNALTSFISVYRTHIFDDVILGGRDERRNELKPTEFGESTAEW